jgi:putative toxin-antitoxin system antitoxin component (TIGR02293 family)
MQTIVFQPTGGNQLPGGRYLDLLSDALGTRIRSDADLVSLAVHRLPTEIIESLHNAGLGWDEISFIIPRRTLTHRRERAESLTVDESDKAIRLARILARAISTFGEADRALRWLRASQQRFGAKSPLELTSTEQGARLVEEAIIQIDEGYFA